MIIGRIVGRTRTGDIIYSEGDTVIPIRNTAFAHGTLAVAIGRAGSCAAGTVTPGASNCGIGYRVVVGVVHSNGHGGGPIPGLTCTCPIYIADMHDGRRGC